MLWKEFFIEHSDYKILHSHVRSYASLYLPIAHKAGLKTIIHSHNTSNGFGIKSVIKKIMQFPLRYQADFFVGCTKDAGEWLFGKKIVEKKNFFLMPNFVDENRFEYNAVIRERYRNDFDVKQKKVLLHVGRFNRAKNHSFLIDLFNAVHKENLETVLILVGDGILYQEIEAKVRKLNLSSHVIFLGERSDVDCIMQAADVFLFPSLWEGDPLSVIEAQIAGLPCVCSLSVSCCSKRSNRCFFLPLEDFDAWVKTILSVLRKKRSAVQLNSEEIFSSLNIVQKYSDLYNELI